MEEDWLIELRTAIVGRFGSVEKREADWAFNFNDGGAVSLGVPWRIIANGRIAFADEDDGQKFGLPKPIDGEAEANRLLNHRAVIDVSVDPETADLALYFAGGLRLDAFNNSAGYEGWQIILPPERGGLWIIALGGGDVSVLS